MTVNTLQKISAKNMYTWNVNWFDISWKSANGWKPECLVWVLQTINKHNSL